VIVILKRARARARARARQSERTRANYVAFSGTGTDVPKCLPNSRVIERRELVLVVEFVPSMPSMYTYSAITRRGKLFLSASPARGTQIRFPPLMNTTVN